MSESATEPSLPLSFGHVLLIKGYGLLWRLARPILRRNKRLADGFDRRLVPKDWAAPADVWMQAASGGEAYLVWETLAALPSTMVEEKPLRVLVTTWTRQGLEVLQGMATTLGQSRPDLHIQVALFPLDHPALMYRAMNMVQPKVVALLETELWPGLLLACKRRKTPVLVLNGRLTAGSLRSYRLLDTLASGYWNAVGPTTVCAMSDKDARRFERLLPPERVCRAPNIKFDRALTALASGAESAASQAASDSGTMQALRALLPPAAPVILLASVREEEERFLLPELRALAANHPEIVLVIAPRHMHRVNAWLDGFAGRSLRLRSALTPELPARPGQIIIWNTFGELSQLYKLATAVFIGGSLAPVGGQNFLEALAAGRIPHTGPHLDNFLWAVDAGSGSESLEACELLRRFPNAEALIAALLAAVQAVEAPETVRSRFLHWLEARKGGAAQNAALLIPYFTPSGDPHGNPS